MATHNGSHLLPGLIRFAFRRMDSAPAHRSRPPLGPGERVLLEERADGSEPVVATTRALHHRGTDGWHQVPWEETGRVRWDERQRTLELVRFADRTRTLSVRLTAGTRIPDLVRERVAATTVVSTRVEVGDTRRAVVSARCRPGTSEVIWIVQLDEDVDPCDGSVQTQVDAAIHSLRAFLGL